MTLLELIANLIGLNNDHTLYAKQPWAPDSEAVVSAPDADGGLVPTELEAQGFHYFLEVDIAKEFAEGWQSSVKSSSPQQLCERLIQYAVNDA